MNSTTPETPQDIAQSTLNQVLVTICGSLSVIGSSIIIITYILWKSIRTTSRLIIVCISIGDFITAATNIIGGWHQAKPFETTPYCRAAATINTIAILSTFFWTTILALYLYLSICRQIESYIERIVLYVFHITAWGIPAVIVFTALGLGKIGNTGDLTSAGWCWIKHSNDKTDMMLWMFLAGKGWELLAYVAIIAFYVKVKLYVQREIQKGFCHSQFLTQGAIQAVMRANRKFTFIPVVFILVRIWGTIRFFREIHHLVAGGPKPKPKQWLIVLHGMGDSFQGFANFLLFCLFTDKIRNRFRLACAQIMPCCEPDDLQPLSLEGTENANDPYGSVEVHRQSWH